MIEANNDPNDHKEYRAYNENPERMVSVDQLDLKVNADLSDPKENRECNDPKETMETLGEMAHKDKKANPE